MASERQGSLSGLTEDEAREMHQFYIQGTALFVIVAVVAHVLVWFWRPWFPGPDGYAALEGVQTALTNLPLLG